jgi:hypothetical protein
MVLEINWACGRDWPAPYIAFLKYKKKISPKLYTHTYFTVNHSKNFLLNPKILNLLKNEKKGGPPF